eukprot:TRINITY_DN753_c0_g1_i1.p1 TRINITY_DN753_c0_g1~~TRINITY_DN753_c0_g1_i1.p1  ORF type:complete len:185 (-),score=55.84 TRINITY_DN753_c0_g1_i1:186-740(-)
MALRLASRFFRVSGPSLRLSRGIFSVSGPRRGGHDGPEAKPSKDGKARAEDRLIKVRFTDMSANLVEVEGIIGETISQCAHRYNISLNSKCNLDGENPYIKLGPTCGGCHVQVSNEFIDVVAHVNPVSHHERDILSEVNDKHKEVNVNSRMGCLVKLSAEMDGMLVLIPTHSEYNAENPLIIPE